MRIFGPNELKADVQDKGLCVGCGACVNLCPYFKNHQGKTVMLFPCTLEKGRCHAYCPKTEVDYTELSQARWKRPYDASPLGTHDGVVMARAGEGRAEGRVQAGGTVSALTAFALREGMIEEAVLTNREGLVPVPQMVGDETGIYGCATSKYTAAPTLSEVNRAAREGIRNVGVVATPCQATALALMRENPLDREDFVDPVSLVIGLFCTWALDTRKLIPFLESRVDVSRIQWMDIPPPPAEVFVLDLGNEEIQIPLDEIRALVPRGCLLCPDMTSEWADVSVGVLEGEPEWNTLIVRTEKGRALVDKAVEAGSIVVKEMPAANLEHLRTAALNKKKRAVARAREENLLNNTDEGERAAFRMDPSVVEELTGS
ncbi:MAG: Coenzyme F420 hydrogenase/dehydrogenase, beta subunit C-terminal domain [Deltaproteobacteria bacterium]|nr:Coenzyme F420 hydrogenase/dehydrogenase, beta subunit C-terminal domain [Deltaproteobacteria bacterium]